MAERRRGDPTAEALPYKRVSRSVSESPPLRLVTSNNLKRLVVEEETLRCAWQQVRVNDGAPGVDGVTFEDIKRSEGGIEGYFDVILQARDVPRPHS